MSTAMLFVTCPKADHKVVNRALWHFKDLQYGSDDRFHVVTTRDVEDINSANSAYDDGETEAGSLRPDTFNPKDNVWAGASLSDVENFVLGLERREGYNQKLSLGLYVIIDEEGAEKQTCIIGDRVFEPGEGESLDDIISPEWQHASKFDKLRCPWEEAYSIWCNLDIANMDFADFADQDAGPSKDGWWTYQSVHDGPDLDDEKRQLRDAEIEKLEQEGNA